MLPLSSVVPWSRLSLSLITNSFILLSVCLSVLIGGCCGCQQLLAWDLIVRTHTHTYTHTNSCTRPSVACTDATAQLSSLGILFLLRACKIMSTAAFPTLYGKDALISTRIVQMDHRQQNKCYPQRYLLVHFEAAHDFSRSEFACP